MVTRFDNQERWGWPQPKPPSYTGGFYGNKGLNGQTSPFKIAPPNYPAPIVNPQPPSGGQQFQQPINNIPPASGFQTPKPGAPAFQTQPPGNFNMPKPPNTPTSPYVTPMQEPGQAGGTVASGGHERPIPPYWNEDEIGYYKNGVSDFEHIDLIARQRLMSEGGTTTPTEEGSWFNEDPWANPFSSWWNSQSPETQLGWGMTTPLSFPGMILGATGAIPWSGLYDPFWMTKARGPEYNPPKK